MSVIFETSKGNFTIDLFVDDCPNTCMNFLKLCKVKYYNNCIFFNVQKDYIAQTGDPGGDGKGGESIFGLLYGEQAKYFEDEIKPHLKHDKIGVVAMANKGPNLNGSQFYITTAADIESLDGKHTIFGEVTEGIDSILAINDVYTDSTGKPLQIIRIRHTPVVFDPFEDPKGLQIPDQSPPPVHDKPKGALGEDEDVDEDIPEEELKERLAEREAKARSEVLAIIGDLPDAEVKPPDTVLFVCKLNPVTTDEDLNLIFSRFGELASCEVIRDRKTGDSLSYAFIEYKTPAECEEAYFKMNNVLIDDRRIHVDFSQSVSKGVDWKSVGGWRGFFAKRAKEKNFEKGDAPRSKYGYDALEHKGGRGGGRGGGGGGGGGKYGMVFDQDDQQDRNKKRPRSRSPPHRRPSSSDEQPRSSKMAKRSPSPKRDERRNNDRRDDRSHRDRDDRMREDDRSGRSDNGRYKSDRDYDRRDDRDRDRNRPKDRQDDRGPARR